MQKMVNFREFNVTFSKKRKKKIFLEHSLLIRRILHLVLGLCPQKKGQKFQKKYFHVDISRPEMCNRLENITITITITIMLRKNYSITTTTIATLEN
jgi:hypothetical protein